MMDQELSHSTAAATASVLPECSLDHHQAQQEDSSDNAIEMADYMLGNPQPLPEISFDKLSFAELMQFTSDRFHDESLMAAGLSLPPPRPPSVCVVDEEEEEENASSTVQQLHYSITYGGAHGDQRAAAGASEAKPGRRKRPRSVKTSKVVETQRMNHIAVERNRRRQMNENLRVLRSLMPGSYVQRGDQASIIGGAIEFVRELEQLLQCLESQKRRRLFGSGDGEAPPPIMDAPLPPSPLFFRSPPPVFTNSHASNALREEMAENKSFLADVEVRLLGMDAMIKILARQRPGQLIKTIEALEDLQFSILHTNITSIEHTVLYSFNVKIMNEARCTAEDIASSVQQILSLIHANTI